MKKTVKTKVLWWTIGIAVTIVLAIFISIEINIYNRPENRLARQLELGHKYLEDQEYEEAAIAFEQAILIDDKCVEAYLGGMEAYSNIGDEENLQVFYDKTLDMVRNMEEKRLEESMEQTVSIYLYADEVYSSSPEYAIEILEEGYQATEEDEAVKEKLVEDYMALVLEQAEENVPDEELTIYDRLLDLDEENEQILESLGLCLEDYINSLMQEENFDDVRMTIAKYTGLPKNVDFEKYLNEIEESEEKKARIEKERIRLEVEANIARKKAIRAEIEKQKQEQEEQEKLQKVIKEQGGGIRDIINSVSLVPVWSSTPELNSLMEQIFAQLFTTDMTAYDKIKACYDWIIMNTDYYNIPIYSYEQAAYIVLQEHVGDCIGYSAAFVQMVKAIGLNCYVQTGSTHKADGGYTPHYWAIVVIDGNEYVFDPQVEDNIAKGGSIGYYRFGKTYAEVPDKYIVGGRNDRLE